MAPTEQQFQNWLTWGRYIRDKQYTAPDREVKTNAEDEPRNPSAELETNPRGMFAASPEMHENQKQDQSKLVR